MNCFDEAPHQEVIMPAADFAQMCEEIKQLHAECDRLRAENECLKQPQQPMSAEEVTEPGIFKGLADSIWIMGAQFGWECCEANDKDRFNHAINTQDFPIAVQVPLKAPEV